MAAMQPEGAAQASQLSGLSLQAGLALAMQRRQFTECAAYPPCPLCETAGSAEPVQTAQPWHAHPQEAKLLNMLHKPFWCRASARSR
jgi:hypothetical protein